VWCVLSVLSLRVQGTSGSPVIDCVSGALVAIHVEAITHDHTDGAICLVIPPAKAEKKRLRDVRLET
jgi:hypothetical protein